MLGFIGLFMVSALLNFSAGQQNYRQRTFERNSVENSVGEIRGTTQFGRPLTRQDPIPVLSTYRRPIPQEPIDCQMRCENFGPCSATCGGNGQQTRRCQVIQEPRNGGRPCGPQVETRFCGSNQECSRDCLVEYGPLSPCDCTGSQTREARIIQQPIGNGQRCPPLREVVPCQRPPQCEPVDCQMRCDDFSPCSATCGGNGQQTRRCQVIQEARNGGRPCGPQVETRFCGSNQECSRDCLVEYGPLSPCDCTGSQTREARIIQQSIGNGQRCPPLREVVPCQRPPQCEPVDCHMECFEYSPCSHTCGGGQQTRQCRVIRQPQNGGRPCGPLTQVRDCGSQNIPCYGR